MMAPFQRGAASAPAAACNGATSAAAERQAVQNLSQVAPYEQPASVLTWRAARHAHLEQPLLKRSLAMRREAYTDWSLQVVETPDGRKKEIFAPPVLVS